MVAWLKSQGAPQYITGVLEEVQATSDGKFINDSGLPQDGEEGGGDADTQLYDKAVAIVTQVNPDGTIETVSGDWNGTGSSEAAFSSSSGPRSGP